MPPRMAACACPLALRRSLFDKTKIGMRVIISPNDAGPGRFLPSRAVRAEARRPSRRRRPCREARRARRRRPPRRPTRPRRPPRPRRARTRIASRRRCASWKQQKARADAELAYADKLLAAAKTDQAKAKAEELKQKAATKAADAATQLDTAKADAKPKRDAAAAAKDAAKAAAAKKAEAAKAATDAKLALEPVSVYISRSTQKLYVRRNTHKPAPDGGGEVFDTSIEVPVTIRNPGQPLGTHIFTAMAKNDTGLRWSVVTIDNGDDAKDALDRITIPQDVLDRIAPTALPRSSIVISDEPLSDETNYRTEFVAVLSNQPQGGFITRKPTAPPRWKWPATTAGATTALVNGFFFFGSAIRPRSRSIRAAAAASISIISRRSRCSGAFGKAAAERSGSRHYGRA